jgi:hypothetical protein
VEDTQGSEKGTWKRMGNKVGKGNRKVMEDGKGKGNGKATEKGKKKGNWMGMGNGTGKGIVEQTPGGDDISCAAASQLQKKCIRQIWTERAN